MATNRVSSSSLLSKHCIQSLRENQDKLSSSSASKRKEPREDEIRCFLIDYFLMEWNKKGTPLKKKLP
jgi:hypothetical protein